MKCETIYRQIIGAGYMLVDIDDGVYIFRRTLHGRVDRVCMDSNGNIYRGKMMGGEVLDLAEVVK